MLDHVALQADDLAASRAFYERLLAPLGVRVAMAYEGAVGFSGPDGFPHFWLNAATDRQHRETHVAFAAPDRAAVEAVHEAAHALGTEVLHAPREWPEYHAGYYAVFVRDPDGNNVEAVTHR